MVQAVIDLISSSPAPPSAAERSATGPSRVFPSATTTSNANSNSTPPEASQSFDQNVFLGGFDSTSDLNDPFASSPAQPSATAGTGSSVNPPRPPAVTAAASNGNNRIAESRQPERSAGISLSAEFEIYSDDFDTTIDLDSRTLVESSGNKRRRLSRSPFSSREHPAEARTIDLSSSPVHATCAFTKRSVQHKFTSPDPFASSPAPDPSTAALPTIQQQPRERSPDPFDSTPITCPPATSRAPPRSPNPFDSTPPTQDVEPQRSRLQPPRPEAFETLSRARSVTKRQQQEWDPISSSAPEAGSTTRNQSIGTVRNANQSNAINIDSSSDAGPDRSEASDDDLPGLNELRARATQPRARTGLSRARSDVITSKNRPKSTRPKPTQPKKSAEERARERQTREAEKESKRIQREKDKEEKTREKAQAAALAEVNKLRTDKKVSTPEMVVDLSDTLGTELRAQVETLLDPLDVQSTTYDSPVEGTIKWRRKVNSEFNDSLGRWEPVPLRIEPEKHVAVVLKADRFVDLGRGENGELDGHVTKLKREFPECHIIYLLEGLTGWFGKNRNKRNRQFTSGVRAQEEASSSASAPPSTTTNRRRRNAAAASTEYIPEDIVEDALMQLQVMHDVLIHHTHTCLETAQWITIFTQHISTIPYRKQRDVATMGAGFCMESGQVRTGEDAPDTYVKMLQEIARVTAPISWGVKAEFGSVTKLVNGLVEGGPDRLANVKKSADKNGAVSDRTIGQAVSKRMYKVFTGRNENSVDI